MSNLLNITITDLFGNNITASSLFIIINSTNIHALMKKIAKDNDTSIWTYDHDLIDEILKQNKLSAKQYVTLGDVFYVTQYVPKQLILAHKSICKMPHVFTPIKSYGDGMIVRPVGQQGYTSIGSYFANSNIQPDKNRVGLLSDEILIEMDNTINANGLSLNNYNLLADDPNSVKTIRQSAFYDGNEKIKLLDSNGKYITKSLSNPSKALAKSKLHSKNQLVTYNTQGELIIDGKCLSYQNNPSSELFFDSCTGDKKQKWNIYEGQISPQTEYQKCVTTNHDSLSLESCDSSDDQSWTTENNDINTTGDYAWNKYKGKTVVLVESDNPWYINVDNTIPMTVKPNTSFDNLNKLRPRNNNADVKTNIILDQTRPNLGMGYSYDTRQGFDCQKIEGFGMADTYAQNNFIFYICVIIILLLLYRSCRQ